MWSIITNNEIVFNELDAGTNNFWGGGVYLVGLDYLNPSSPTITGNLIEGNVANSAQGQNSNNPTFSVAGGIYMGTYVAATITARLGIPTIGIGAGAACDGQILVIGDLLGILPGKKPRFVRQYLDFHSLALDAIRADYSGPPPIVQALEHTAT